MEPIIASIRTWHCGNGHTFTFGDEDWHYELNQGYLVDGSPIPMYCTERYENDEPCMDSSSLIYD